MTMVATGLVVDAINGIIRRIYKSGEVRVAGWTGHRGYVYLTVSNKRRAAHQVIWEHVNGRVPDGFEIDHIDGNPSNNSILNLRLLTHAENMQNRHLPSGKNKTSGVKGVHWDKDRQKWRTHIVVNGKQYHIGRFDSLDSALSAYRKAAGVHHTYNPHADNTHHG
jgi:HNH endonuclease/AP2 domain